MAEELAGNLIYVCEADLKEGEMRGLKVAGQWLLIVRHETQYYAMDAACAHSGFPLHQGKFDKGVVTCGLHYAQFDCRSGKVVSNPAICGNQIIFQIKVKDGKVFWSKTS